MIFSSVHTSRCTVLWSKMVQFPNCDAAAQDAFDSPFVEHAKDGGFETSFPQPSQKIEMLLGFLGEKLIYRHMFLLVLFLLLTLLFTMCDLSQFKFSSPLLY